jgi:hypothetical protein
MELALCYTCWIRMGGPGAAGCGALLNPYGYGWVNSFTLPV